MSGFRGLGIRASGVLGQVNDTLYAFCSDDCLNAMSDLLAPHDVRVIPMGPVGEGHGGKCSRVECSGVLA